MLLCVHNSVSTGVHLPLLPRQASCLPRDQRGALGHVLIRQRGGTKLGEVPSRVSPRGKTPECDGSLSSRRLSRPSPPSHVSINHLSLVRSTVQYISIGTALLHTATWRPEGGMQTVCFFLYRRPPPRARLRRQLAVAPVVCPVPSLFFFVSSLPPPPPFNLDEYEQTCPGIERVESLPLRAEKYGKTKGWQGSLLPACMYIILSGNIL